jgi:hypothetical protein
VEDALVEVQEVAQFYFQLINLIQILEEEELEVTRQQTVSQEHLVLLSLDTRFKLYMDNHI